MNNKITNFLKTSENSIFLYLSLIFFIGYFTIFSNYYKPPYQFWDENYHIASAEKYIEGVMFMEPHPPLGKMFIALGEVLLKTNKNIDKNYFTETDYITYIPENFTFRGVRFFSTFFALFSSLLFYGIIYQFSKKPFFSFLMTFLYLFENAMILHSRSAMLEGIQFFFVLSVIFYFFYLLNNKLRFNKINYLYLGVLAGLAVSVKINSLIVTLLPIFLYIYETFYLNGGAKTIKKIIYPFINKILFFTLGLLSIVLLVFYIHFALGSKLSPKNSYSASPEYIKIIQTKKNMNILNYFTMLKDNLRYMQKYQTGVPKLDKSKPDENGSYPLEWLIGSKTINYRWNKYNDKVSYLYLMGNPVIWLSGLIGLLLSFSLVSSKFIFGIEEKNKKTFFLTTVFFILYICYMITVIPVDRVLYLYHYFIPLLFSLILFALIFYYIFENELINNDKVVYISLGIICVSIVIVFIYYSPFIYYKALNSKEFLDRVWFDFWGLKHVN